MEINTKEGKINLNGTELDVVCSFFGDRVFLSVSELQKLGTLLEVSCDPIISGTAPTFSVKTLLGKDEDEVHVFGRAIASHLSLPPNTPLLLSIGLKDHQLSLIPQLLKELEPFRTWDSTHTTIPHTQ